LDYGNRRVPEAVAMTSSHLPSVAFIEGDGTGPEIWRATRNVVDAAVTAAYGGSRRIMWREVLAGEKAFRETGQWLPAETIQAIRKYGIGIKGPLATPVGEGVRSMNVTLRRLLDLYACVRPVRYVAGVPSPMKHPERVDIVVFRENTEDVYAGIEFESNGPEANRLREFLWEAFGKETPEGSALGIKPISPFGSKRLVRMAIQYAIEHHLPSVTLVHKGNIMKFTEGGFRKWGYDLALEEFADQTVAEKELAEGRAPGGEVVIKDRIADMMFQQLLLRPEDYHVIATTNLNGDYLSDALAAQAGGLGMAPGGNFGEGIALFEATHGTAPKYAGQDKINPSSLILSGAMMLKHMGWHEAVDRVHRAMEKTIAAKTVTYDLARQMPDAQEVTCSGFAERVISRMEDHEE
jgi:isocitrate dehydrogenase